MAKRVLIKILITTGRPTPLQRNNAQVIANSIINLKEKGLIFSPEDDPHILSELKRQGAGLQREEGEELRTGEEEGAGGGDEKKEGAGGREEKEVEEDN